MLLSALEISFIYCRKVRRPDDDRWLWSRKYGMLDKRVRGGARVGRRLLAKEIPRVVGERTTGLVTIQRRAASGLYEVERM